VAEHRTRVDAHHRPPNGVEVGDLRLDGHLLRSVHVERPAAPSLVVVDEPYLVGETIEVRSQVLVAEIGTAVDDEDGSTVADDSNEEPTGPVANGRLVHGYIDRTHGRDATERAWDR